MSLSDLFNISKTVRRDKAREQNLIPEPSSSTSVAARLCNICFAKPASYNCPRCNIPYCSLACFRRSEHQECSTAFSSSAIRLASSANELEPAENDRRNVVDILSRLEKDEKNAKQAQSDAEDDESDDDDEDLDLHLTEQQIENASPEQLLAMLPPRQRQKFLDAVKDPQSAANLMGKFDRRADRRDKQASLGTEGSALTTLQPTTDHQSRHRASKRAWQSAPWFDKPEACPAFSDKDSQGLSAFATSLAKLLSAQSTAAIGQPAPAPINLSHNLCAVLMAYTYTLRHLDLESLSGALNRPAEPIFSGASSIPPLGPPDFAFPDPSEFDNDDEPPPLEPDEPDSVPSSITSAHPSAAATALLPIPNMQVPSPTTLASDIFDKLDALIPFLFSQPAPSANHPSAHDPSKLVLTSIDDACMWLISRLSLDSELGEGGVDGLQLQLLEDLNTLLAAEQLVPTFKDDEVPEPKYRVAFQLATLPPQQAFAAAQSPLVLNAVADLYLYLEHLASLAADPSSSQLPPNATSKSIKLAQRKLCFYLSSVVFSDRTIAEQAGPKLRQEVQHSIQNLRSRIDAMLEADKLAAAVSRLDSTSLHTP